MNKESTFLAIIPAREGSKRLPQKNIRTLFGKPLIQWTIEAAKKSQYLDDIIVSSDDKAILQLAQTMSVKSFSRPTELAQDDSTTMETIEHVLQHCKTYDYIVLLQPTSPLRKATHIDEAIKYLHEKKADAMISVTTSSHTPLWSNTLPKDNNMSGFLKEELKNKRSQELPTYYELNGAIYICKTSRLLKEKTLFIKDNIYAFIMDKKSSVDIDEELDLLYAQTILQQELN